MPYIIFIAFFLVITYKGFFEKNALVSLLPNLILLSGICRYAFFRRNKLYTGKVINAPDFYVYTVFLVLLIVSSLRTSFPDATIAGIFNDIFTLLLINLLAYVCFSYFFGKEAYSQAATRTSLSIFSGPALLILVIVVFYFIQYDQLPSVRGDFRSKPVILGLLGFDLENKVIAVKGGSTMIHPNTLGIYAGALFVAIILALQYLKFSRSWRWLLRVFALSLGILVLITDSRMTIFNTFFSLGLILVARHFSMIRLIPYLAFVLPFLPFLSLFLLAGLADFEFMAQLSKGTNDIATGSERAVIWQYCLQELLEPKAIHLWGYGEYGHYRAGTSLLYSKIAGPEADDLGVTHNTFFQAFYDIGYIGAIVFILLLYSVTKSAVYLYGQGVKSALIYLGFMTYFMLSGIFESVFGNYNRMYTLIFMLMCVAVLVHKNEHLKAKQADKEKGVLAGI